MANYWITNNAKFRPFSYDEMIKPVERMYTEHSKIEEGLSELQMKAGIWEGLANQQSDPDTYAQYKRYADELRLAANDLAMNGLNATSRQNLFNMKARYASEITPIEQAYQLRAADIKAQADASAKSGGRTIFSKSARTASLDDYKNGMPLDYTSVNLDSVYNTVASGTQAITKRYFNTKEGSAFKNEYFKLIQQQGLNPTEAFEALKHSGKYKELDKYYNDALQSFGISNFSEADQARIMNAADMGMNAGIYYDQKEQLKENPWMDYQRDLSKMAIQHRYQKDLIDYQNQQTTASRGFPGNTVEVHLPVENAGEEIKRQMAKQTMAAVADAAKAGNKGAQEQLKEWKKKYGSLNGKIDKASREKIIADLVKNGWNGDISTEESKKLYYDIGNYIRRNVTKDENLINIWRAPFSPMIDAETAKQINKGKAWGPAAPGGGAFANGSIQGTLDKWNATKYGSFNERAKKAYTVNAVQLSEDQGAVSAWLDSWFNSPRSSAGQGKVHLYDIASSTRDGRQITRGKTPKKIKDLPLKTNGSVDTSDMHRTHLPNGDYLITWRDSKGELQQGLLPAEAVGEEKRQRKVDLQKAYEYVNRNNFPESKYTDEDLNIMKANIFNSSLEGDYLDTQVVKVEPFKIGG